MAERVHNFRKPAQAAGLKFGSDSESQARLDDILRDAAVIGVFAAVVFVLGMMTTSLSEEAT